MMAPPHDTQPSGIHGYRAELEGWDTWIQSWRAAITMPWSPIFPECGVECVDQVAWRQHHATESSYYFNKLGHIEVLCTFKAIRDM